MINVRPVASPGATSRAQPTVRGQTAPEAAAGPRLARTIVAQVEDDYEPRADDAVSEWDDDIGEGWPDGWEGGEVDAAALSDDDSPRTAYHCASPRPALTFFGDSSSSRTLSFEIDPPVSWLERLVDERTPWIEAALNERRHRLHRLALALRVLQGDALIAPDRRAAYLRLSTMSKRWLDDEMRLPDSSGWTSRNRSVLVACPWGTVPLDFFTWGLTSERADIFESLLNLVIGEGVRDSDSSIARRVLQEVPRANPMRGSIRKLVPVAKGLATPEVAYHIAMLRRSCLTWSGDALDYNPSVAAILKGRGKELARFAVAGWERGYQWIL